MTWLGYLTPVQMSRPLLSIITVNRNNATGLARTLQSLTPVRSDPLLEFIAVDGLSTDTSLAIASDFYDPDLCLSEADVGVYDAMNKGLALASGRYCYWLNSGDLFVPQCWPRLRALLLDAQEALLACGVIPFAAGGSELPPCFADPVLLPHSSLNHQSLFFRTDVIRRLGGYYLRYGLTADRELVLRLLATGASIRYEPLVVARYELGGLSSHSERLRRDHLRVSRAHGLISPIRYAWLLLRFWLGRGCLGLLAISRHRRSLGESLRAGS